MSLEIIIAVAELVGAIAVVSSLVYWACKHEKVPWKTEQEQSMIYLPHFRIGK